MAELPIRGDAWRRLIGRIARVTGDSQDAEDHLHSAFVRLELYSRREAVANPEAFMVRAAANIALDQRRRAAVRALNPMSYEALAQIGDDRPLHDEAMAVRARLARVRQVLDGLPARTREIFLAHRLEGLKYREIAADHGISVSAVEKHIARAVLALTGAAGDE